LLSANSTVGPSKNPRFAILRWLAMISEVRYRSPGVTVSSRRMLFSLVRALPSMRICPT